MSIPSIEERQVRSCLDYQRSGCVFAVSDDQAETCSLLSWIDKEHRCWHNRLSELRSGPCKYHYTKEEMKKMLDIGMRLKELIDSGVIR